MSAGGEAPSSKRTNSGVPSCAPGSRKAGRLNRFRAGWKSGAEQGLLLLATETIYAIIYRGSQAGEKLWLWLYLYRRKKRRGRRKKRQ